MQSNGIGHAWVTEDEITHVQLFIYEIFVSDYLYRVLAENDAGSGTSHWGYGRTKEGGMY